MIIMEKKGQFEISILLLILAVFLFSSAEDDSLFSNVSGVKLWNINSSICAELDFKTLDTFYFCSFIKFNFRRDPGYSTSTIFVLRDVNNYVIVQHKTFYNFFVIHNGKRDEYVKGVTVFDPTWMKLCLSRSNNSQIELSINYQTPKKHPLPELEIELPEKERSPATNTIHMNEEVLFNDSFTSDGENATLCIGNSMDYQHIKLTTSRQIIEEVAGITVNDKIPQSRSIDDSESENECISSFRNHQTFDFTEEKWSSNEVNLTSSRVEDLCLDTYIITFINKSANYEEHSRICRNLNGRFLSLNEVKHFLKYFTKFFEEKRSTISGSEELGLWLPGGNLEAKTLKSYCQYVELFYYGNIRRDIVSVPKPCILDVTYNFCISPSHSDFTYYGSLLKYDTNYFLSAVNYSVVLEGDEFSSISKINDKWILKSQLHKESCELKAFLPIGRNTWKTNEGILKDLTFTYCKRGQFACSNGECLPSDARCNGFVDCFDKSDEDKCTIIQKEKGYLVNMMPHPRKRDKIFKLNYSFVIFNIADITSEKGIAVVDAMITLSWFDPRITFWNPVSQSIDCNEIWSPVLSMADASRSGFQIEFKEYRSSCQILRNGEEKNINRKRSYKDAYMGTYVEGRRMKISYIFSGLITVPCRFNLRRYPFGTQTCNITFWADNAYLTESPYELIHDSLDNYKNYTQYEGRTELGEYHFISVDHAVERTFFVTLIIKLQNLYAYHVLNSFTPSILICIITYSTLFFPISDCSDRIMVSLTALLVLAALFTQASDKSVMTPYFKLLDIWFVVLISFCFLLVSYNIVLRKILSMEEKKANKLLQKKKDERNENYDSDYEVSPHWKKNVVRKNFVAIVFFTTFFLCFILFFCLAGAEII